jgi:hypothetical protein
MPRSPHPRRRGLRLARLLALGFFLLATLACGRSEQRASSGRDGREPAAGLHAGEGGPAPSDSARAVRPPFPAATADRRLRDGVYPVLREAASADSAHDPERAHVVLPYDDRYSEPAERSPRTYVALDTTSWVPMILEGSPERRPDGSGRTLLGVTLDRRYAKLLEAFTTRHLGGRIAIVLDDEIVTMHKIRSVIREGKVQITRCDDNACEVLYSKLTR